MKNQSFNILFIMRSTRIKKNGLASIYPRITTGGMRLSESVARTAQRGAGISVRHPRRRQQGRTDDSRPHPAGNRSGTLHRGSVAVGPEAAEAYRMSGAETKNNSDNILSKIHIIMKIMCQEHYDKVVHYADQIGDKSLQQCLDKLKAWELHSRRP